MAANIFFRPTTSYKLQRSSVGLERELWVKDPPATIDPSNTQTYTWTTKGDSSSPTVVHGTQASATSSILDPKNNNKHTGDFVTLSWNIPNSISITVAPVPVPDNPVYHIEVKNAASGEVKAAKSFTGSYGEVDNVYFELADASGKVMGFRVDVHG